ncbi:hypothetical protein B0J12DRAFT_438534 [Macrophomina phaseolina]|uniref:Secreted protein n=1 Tax=Macrophomina phaseolina TaxID=35725 RepID=A0ABQ8GHQ4_9PEZI|nr:hypothetical protein B0J12DRAFT_438534 [Macrophomina phaseolina]
MRLRKRLRQQVAGVHVYSIAFVLGVLLPSYQSFCQGVEMCRNTLLERRRSMHSCTALCNCACLSPASSVETTCQRSTFSARVCKFWLDDGIPTAKPRIKEEAPCPA